MLIKTFCSGPAQTNTYLIGCSQTQKAAIIDTPPGSAQWIIETSKKLNLSIEKILLTHSHWDHTADAACLKKELAIPLFVHEKDANNVENPGSDGLPLLISITPTQVDHFLQEGQSLQLGNLSFTVLHTPGHTPGGVCFFFPQERVLFSGDTLFKGTIGNLSFSTANPDHMWTSLRTLAALPSDTQVFPGHGGSTTIESEKWIQEAKQHLGF